MAKIDINIPTLSGKFIDLRDSIPGDSYNWSWVRPLSQVNYLAIHHSAGPDTQTPVEIANYHINNNGWGGIGYHFLIGKDGTVFYVGDISTARANVANLNEQVIGICLIGNFTLGRAPTNEQLDSTRKLCDFFINDYSDLSNVKSWDAVFGHKDLPGQSTTCPGDNWPSWRPQIVEGTTPTPSNNGGIIFNSPAATPSSGSASGVDRGAQITDLYRTILGRDPDMGGLQTYTNGPMSIDDIMRSMVNSLEHQNLITLAKKAPDLQSQVDNLQTTLASVNQQVITLKETLQEREQEIVNLNAELAKSNSPVVPSGNIPTSQPQVQPNIDNTVTIIGALINLFKFIFSPRSAN